MAVIQDININVYAQPSEKRLRTFLTLSQNENGRLINFRILGAPLPSNCVATFSGTKPDGNVYSTTGTVTGNFVVVAEDMQMTAVAGVWDAKLDIINGTHNIMTALIRVVVDADVVDPDAIASDSQLQGLVAEAKYYAEEARIESFGAPLTAALKADMLDKTRVYVYTGSETGMTAGHWYYWNGSAWTDGGVYNAAALDTDKTLSVPDKAADGKATGDALALKVDKVTGKGLSTNDYTTAEKTKLSGIAEGATKVEIDSTLSTAGKAADAKKTGDEISQLMSEFTAIDNNLGVYDIGTTYNTLNATYNRVMAVYPIKNVNDTFFFSVKDKSTNGTLSIRVCSSPTPYSADLLESVGSMGNADTDLSGSFTISDSAKANAKYIIFLNATANLVVTFNVTMWTEKSVTGELKHTTETTDFLNTATMFDFQQYVQGGVSGTTGADAYSLATVRPDAYFDTVDLVKVVLGSNSGLHVQLYSYGADLSYLGRNDLGASVFSYTAKQIQAYRNAKYVRFAIYLDGGGNFSPSDLESNGKFAVTLTSISAIPSMNRNTNTVFSNILKKVGTTPMASWIDDDGVVIHTNGGINGVVVPVADAVGIPVTFAVIPPLSDSVTVDGQTMTKADYFKERQREGHQIVAHPVHTYWYGSQYDITEVNPSLIECLTELQSNGFLHSDMLVYPGSSGADNTVVEIVRKWCKCGVLSGYGTPNHLGDSTKWAIKRTFVNFEDYNSIHSSDAGYTSAMDWYKSQIDDAYANGDWIVFGTHSYQFTTSTDTSDPNANTMGNLQMLMQYAVDKGLEFRTLWDAYNRRKYLFEFNEINQ